MNFTTRAKRAFKTFTVLGDAPGTYRRESGESTAADDPFVFQAARPARAAAPETRIGEAAEMLRSGPYRVVPVTLGGRLVGMVTERCLVDALLSARTVEDRAGIRESPVSSVMAPPPELWAEPGERVRDLVTRFAASESDTLPVLDDGVLLGLIARSDLVQDLVRPFRPPTVGGMATPAGVYLTTGAVSGGVSLFALVGAGFAMFMLETVSTIAVQPAFRLLAAHLPAHAPPVLTALGSDVVPSLAGAFLLLLFVRLSPVAGYHAAEHQVVHAIERAEPLLPANVRAMPRVHPRCGTNLMAGALIFWVVFSVLDAALTAWAPSLRSLSYMAGGIVALAYWRSVGGWMQKHLTTRPASDAQIASGIRAARQLLERHGRNPGGVVRPHIRLWRMGFAQMMAGFMAGYGLLCLLSLLSPTAAAAIRQWNLL